MQEMLFPDDAVRDPAAIAAQLAAKKYAADIVEALNRLEPHEAASVLARLPADRAVELFEEQELDDPAGLITEIPEEQSKAVLNGLSADRATDIFQQLPPADRTRLLALLSPDNRAPIESLLIYPANTAGALMTTEFVSVPSTWTIGQTLQHVRVVERTRETIYAIYVLDPYKRTLQQVVTLRRLVAGDPDAPITSAGREPITTKPLVDREDVARIITKYDLLAVPVVDERNHVLGIVTVDDIIDAIIKEGTEDVQKFGGVAALDEPYMEIGLWRMLQKRAGWLAALFIGEMLTATAMGYFEHEIARAVVLALFVPLIISSGGNSGSQATSLVIRAMALGEVRLRDWWRVALRELPSGFCLGLFLGAIGVCRILLWQKVGWYNYGPHYLLVALTVGAALIGVVTFGSLAGSMLPFVLRRLGFDPASASAPFVATLVDVTGLVIYFSVGLVLLRGTLL
jgi:magnesium transporter